MDIEGVFYLMYTMEVVPVHDHKNPMMVFSIRGLLALLFYQIQIISTSSSWKEMGSLYLPSTVVECCAEWNLSSPRWEHSVRSKGLPQSRDWWTLVAWEYCISLHFHSEHKQPSNYSRQVLSVHDNSAEELVEYFLFL